MPSTAGNLLIITVRINQDNEVVKSKQLAKKILKCLVEMRETETAAVCISAFVRVG